MYSKSLTCVLGLFMLVQSSYSIYNPKAEEAVQKGRDNVDYFARMLMSVELPTDLKLANPEADKTINDILRHFRVTFTNERASKVVLKFVANFREVMTSPVGSENVLYIVRTLSSILKDPAAAKTVISFFKGLRTLASTDAHGDRVMRSVATAIVVIFKHPNAGALLDGVFDGLDKFLDGLDRDQIITVSDKLKKLLSMTQSAQNN